MTAARIAVIGAGAVGGIAAAVLAGLGHKVTLCVRRPIPTLIVEWNGVAKEAPVLITEDAAALTAADWVLLATKGQDTAGAMPWLERLVGPDTIVVVLQNGIDHVERVGSLLRVGQVLPAVVYSSGQVVAPGRIRADATHRYVVPQESEGSAFAALFKGSVLTIEQSEDFTTAAWRKFLVNVTVNPITALTMRRIGIMREPGIRALARNILTEAVAVGRATGAQMADGEIERLLDSFTAHDPDIGSSMYFDRLAGRQMEHEQLTGTLVDKAAKLGIETPFNSAILALLRGLQEALASAALKVPSYGA